MTYICRIITMNSDTLQMMKKVNLFFGVLFGCVTAGYSQTTLSNQQQGNTVFPIVTSSSQAMVYYDPTDEEVVKKTTKLFAEDVARVTGKELSLTTTLPSSKDYVIIVGTLGKNKLIEKLIAQKKLDVNPIRNGWEQYAIELIERPFPGIKKALVVAGSDRRGTSYGLFSISETIGVSP